MLARNKGLFAEPMTCWSQAAAREPGFSWCSVGSAPPRLSPIERTFGLLAAAIREEASHTRVETTVMGKVFNASTGEDYHTRDTRLLPEQTSTPHRYSLFSHPSSCIYQTVDERQRRWGFMQLTIRLNIRNRWDFL